MRWVSNDFWVGSEASSKPLARDVFNTGKAYGSQFRDSEVKQPFGGVNPFLPVQLCNHIAYHVVVYMTVVTPWIPGDDGVGF